MRKPTHTPIFPFNISTLLLILNLKFNLPFKEGMMLDCRKDDSGHRWQRMTAVLMKIFAISMEH